MRPSSTARRYAEAAFDVAKNDNDIEDWLTELRSVADAMRDRSLALYFKDPNVPVDEKLQTLGKVFENVRPHLMNLLRILTVKQRMYLVPQILTEFEDLERENRGVLEAFVTVARAVDDREERQIAERLGALTGKQVDVHLRVDPGIIGGVVVRIGDQLIDGSVAGRLQQLRQEMTV